MCYYYAYYGGMRPKRPKLKNAAVFTTAAVLTQICAQNAKMRPCGAKAQKPKTGKIGDSGGVPKYAIYVNQPNLNMQYEPCLKIV